MDPTKLFLGNLRGNSFSDIQNHINSMLQNLGFNSADYKILAIKNYNWNQEKAYCVLDFRGNKKNCANIMAVINSYPELTSEIRNGDVTCNLHNFPKNDEKMNGTNSLGEYILLFLKLCLLSQIFLTCRELSVL